MLMLNLRFNLFYAPDSEGGTSELTPNAILDELNKEDEISTEEIDIKPTKKVKVEEKEEETSEEDEEEQEESEEESEEEDELDELEEEIEEEETEEDLQIHQAITRKELKTAYPDIFKKFPELDRTIGRENAFSAIFPTVNEAREAGEKSKLVDLIESDVIKGDTTRLLGAFHNNKKVFGKIVDNYLPNLFKIDQNAYYTVIGNTIKETVKGMLKTAEKEGNKDLAEAAENLYKFVFNSSTWEDPIRLSKNEDKEDEEISKINKEREEFNKQRFEVAKSSLDDKIESRIKRTIEKYIDPKDSMTAYIKKNAVKDAYSSLSELINADSRFSSALDRFWKNASQNNFDKKSMSLIEEAIISTTKKYLPESIKRARNEALGSKSKSKRKTETEEEERPLNRTKAKSIKNESSIRQSGKSDRDRAREIPKTMSTLDYLNS